MITDSPFPRVDALPGGQFAPINRVTSNPALYDRRFDDFAARVHRFASGLSCQQRAAVSSRRRFYSMPFLRCADKPDFDDTIPGITSGYASASGPNYP